MPFALVFVGIILVTAGVRDKTSDLYTLVKGDIESNGSQKGYIYWMVAILIIGSLGYIDSLKSLSRAFMALVIVVLFLKAGNPQAIGGGFFAQFFSALGLNPQSSVPNEDTTLANIVGSTQFTPTSNLPSIGQDTTLSNIIGNISIPAV